MKKLERENFEKNFFPPMGGKTPLVGREVLTITYGKHVPIMGPTPELTINHLGYRRNLPVAGVLA